MKGCLKKPATVLGLQQPTQREFRNHSNQRKFDFNSKDQGTKGLADKQTNKQKQINTGWSQVQQIKFKGLKLI